MKYLLLAILITLSAQSALAGRCFSQGSGHPADYILVAVINSLKGELDPHVLGDGGLMAFQDALDSKIIVVYEPGEEAPYTTIIEEEYRSPDPRQRYLLMIKKDCLKKATRREASTMQELQEGVLRIPGNGDYYRLEE
jgi:hypothetical protein